MTALIIADVTKGTGRFNLAQGIFGTLRAFHGLMESGGIPLGDGL
jgi:hypothetical protein